MKQKKQWLTEQVCVLLVSGYDLLHLIRKTYCLDQDFESKIDEALAAYRLVINEIEEVLNNNE